MENKAKEMPSPITIDGPAGSGKSTIAKQLARTLDYTYLDTGAMYRALTLQAMKEGLDLEDQEAILDLVERIDLHLESLPSGTKVEINGRDVSQEIRRPAVSRKVRHVATHPQVREALCQLQREFAQGKAIIAEGRDMGTVVFPQAPIKIYLHASIEERVRRRREDMKEMGCTSSKEEIRREIMERDYQDTHRQVAPLKPAKDAIRLDTTGLNINEVMEAILKIVREKAPSSR